MFNKSIESISILINNSCDRSCTSCYLTGLKDSTQLTNKTWEKDWKDTITKIILSQAQDLVFAGKEPFFDEKSFELVLWSTRQRDVLQGKNRKTRISVITNGTFFLHNANDKKRDEFVQRYINSSIDFTNISIDGDPIYHDKNRGPGSWARTLPNLKKLLDNPNKVWVITTIYDDNIQSIPKMVQLLRNEGVRKIAFGLYHEIQNNNQLTLKRETLELFASKILPNLLHSKGDSPLKIIISLDTSQKKYVEIFQKYGWSISKKTSFQKNVQKSIVDTRTLGNTTIKVWHDPFYWDYSKRIRITSTFDMLGSEQLVYVNDIKKLSPVNLKDYNFNILKAREAALKSKKFKGYLRNAIKRELVVDPKVLIYHPDIIKEF